MDIKKKYISLYIKRNLKACALFLLVISICSLIGFILEHNNCIENCLKKYFYISIIFFIITLFIFLFSLIYIYRFKSLIKIQEKRFMIKFNDNNNELLNKYYLNYLSDEWYIHGASFTIYYKYIYKTKYKKVSGGKGGNAHYIIFITIDKKKYKLRINSRNDYYKIYHWYKNLRQK